MAPNKSPSRTSASSVRRLSRYYRSLQAVHRQGLSHISSSELADRNGVTSAQVRKDLSAFGNFGKRGLGYPVEGLRDAIASIMGLDRQWNVVLIGVGNIGSALLRYAEFRRQGFVMVAAFDVAASKVGTRVNDVPVHHIDDLPRIVKKEGAEIGILSVPAPNAQEAFERMVKAGIRAVLNFAPVNLNAPDGVTVRYENMAVELETLAYELTSRQHVDPD